LVSPATETLDLPVLGMTCAACQHHVEDALRSMAGVDSVRVDLMAHRANVVFNPAIARPEQLVEAIRGAGYDAVLPRAGQAASDSVEFDEEKSASRKAWVTIAAGAAAMLLAMPLGNDMGAVDHALMKLLPWLYAIPADVLRWSLLVLAAVILVWAGRTIYSSAIRALRHGATNMNTLVALGTSVAFIYSDYSTVAPAPGRAVYFDAVLLILGFLLLGKSMEGRAKRRALSALQSLSHLRPAMARRVVNGVEVETPLEQVRLGDEIVVLPGERFPVDGAIIEGRTTVDESMLTGESTPIAREVGGRVLAGSLNYDGAVVCRAESLGEQTVVSKITRMVEQAQRSRAPMERLADRASAIFVPVVLVLALITCIVWLVATGSVSMALANTVAVLVIACPCAMGLAVPAALTVAVGRGAQLGVLFKGGEALERLAHLDVVVLDKTGTLTAGRPVLEAIHVIDSHGLPPYRQDDGDRMGQPAAVHGTVERENELLRMAAAAEERSNHPLAHAIVECGRARGLKWERAQDVQVLPGRGLTACLAGRKILLGNEALFAEFFVSLPAAQSAPEPGVTRLWMAIDLKPVAYFDARDTLRPDANKAVEALRRSGHRVLMLTGDSAAAAAPIAQAAGIAEVEAGSDPAMKLARIRELQNAGLRVAMVGDGINDAAALAQADAGVAMGSGADLAQEAGDVLLLRAQPSLISASIDLARASLRTMRQNLFWAAGYNVLGIPIAAGLLYPEFHILLTPWLASAAMALSSVCVLGNSLRLRGWRPAEIVDSGHTLN
jgi:Cu+-exporting ATPase